ncbi:hypothetical protein BDV93DRAFT_298633 [Ceratobasidium sp. AG-I]|nr:hypothetical protein BDV93DRAFT_298633 [Ceratobasidium sp. AG-I]
MRSVPILVNKLWCNWIELGQIVLKRRATGIRYCVTHFNSGSAGCGFLGCKSLCYDFNLDSCSCDALRYESTPTPQSRPQMRVGFLHVGPNVAIPMDV